MFSVRERRGKFVEVFDGRKWPVVRGGSIYVAANDTAKHVTSAIVTGTSITEKKKRTNKYTVAVGTTHGHIQAFLHDSDSVLSALDECQAEEKCLMLIKKPKTSSKLMLKSHSWANLSVSDSQLYRQLDGSLHTDTRRHKYKWKKRPDQSSSDSGNGELAPKLYDTIPRKGQSVQSWRDDVNSRLFSVSNGSTRSVENRPTGGQRSRSEREINNNNTTKPTDTFMYHSCVDLPTMPVMLESEEEEYGRIGNDELYSQVKEVEPDPESVDPVSRCHSLGDLSTGLTLSVIGQRKADSMLNLSQFPNGRNPNHGVPTDNDVTHRQHQQPEMRTDNRTDRTDNQMNRTDNKTYRTGNRTDRMDRMDSRTDNRTDRMDRTDNQMNRTDNRTHRVNNRTDNRTDNRMDRMDNRTDNRTDRMDNRTHNTTDRVDNRTDNRTDRTDDRTDIRTNDTKLMQHPERRNSSQGRSSQQSTSSEQGRLSVSSSVSGGKTKRSLPHVPVSEQTERIKRFTELMKARMALHSSTGQSGSSQSPQTQPDSGKSSLIPESCSSYEVVELLQGGQAYQAGKEKDSSCNRSVKQTSGKNYSTEYKQNCLNNQNVLNSNGNVAHQNSHGGVSGSVNRHNNASSSERRSDSGQTTLTSHSHSSTMDSGYATNDCEGDLYSLSAQTTFGLHRAGNSVQKPHFRYGNSDTDGVYVQNSEQVKRKSAPLSHNEKMRMYSSHEENKTDRNFHSLNNSITDDRSRDFVGDSGSRKTHHNQFRPICENNSANQMYQSVPQYNSTNQIHHTIPQYNSTNEIHQSVTKYNSTNQNYQSIPHYNSASQIHQSVQQYNSANQIHQSVKQYNSTSQIHQSVPQYNSTNPNYQSVPQCDSTNQMPRSNPKYNSTNQIYQSNPQCDSKRKQIGEYPKETALANQNVHNHQHQNSRHDYVRNDFQRNGFIGYHEHERTGNGHPMGYRKNQYQSLDNLYQMNSQGNQYSTSRHVPTRQTSNVQNGSQTYASHNRSNIPQQWQNSAEMAEEKPCERRKSEPNKHLPNWKSYDDSFHQSMNSSFNSEGNAENSIPFADQMRDASHRMRDHLVNGKNTNIHVDDKIEGNRFSTLPGGFKFQSNLEEDSKSSMKNPTLHQLSQLYIFHPVKLMLCKSPVDDKMTSSPVKEERKCSDGLTLADIAIKLPGFQEEAKDSGTVSSPQGNYAKLGGPGSAFRPVRVPANSTAKIITIQEVSKEVQNKCMMGNLLAGDFLVEMNGRMILGAEANIIQKSMEIIQGEITLTVARLKDSSELSTEPDSSDSSVTSSLNALRKEIEHLQTEISKRDQKIRNLESSLPRPENASPLVDRLILNGIIDAVEISDDEFIV